LEQCPICGTRMLYWNFNENTFSCTNCSVYSEKADSRLQKSLGDLWTVIFALDRKENGLYVLRFNNVYVGFFDLLHSGVAYFTLAKSETISKEMADEISAALFLAFGIYTIQLSSGARVTYSAVEGLR